MNVVFISNYLNHHQLPFCREMSNLTKDNFIFIATAPVPKERKELGYHDMNEMYPFVLCAYKEEISLDQVKKIIIDADVVVWGDAPEMYLRRRLEMCKLTFRFSERVLRSGYLYALSPKRFKQNWNSYYKYKNNNQYLLCASSYTAGDYAINGMFINKAYKWGYFPEVFEYNTQELFFNKNKELTLLWVGRLISLKHPEEVIWLASKLKQENIKFTMNIIGTGELQNEIEKSIFSLGLDDYVHLLGAMSPENVRHYMEQANIFLFTSDYLEGWGAVINEAMNSGCAVIANQKAGSVRFLIKDKKNGIIYRKKQQLLDSVLWFVNHPDEMREMGEHAYATLVNEWNAKEASKRLCYLANTLLNKEKFSYSEGPCSRARCHFGGYLYKNRKKIKI